MADNGKDTTKSYTFSNFIKKTCPCNIQRFVSAVNTELIIGSDLIF